MLDRKARVRLNALGAAIGTGAVVLLVALGSGARDAIMHEFSSLRLGDRRRLARAHRDARASRPSFAGNTCRSRSRTPWSATRGARDPPLHGPRAIGTARVEAKPRGRNVVVVGPHARLVPHVGTQRRRRGRSCRLRPAPRWPRVAVLGTKLAAELFAGENPLGRMVRIGGTSFRVIGVVYKGRALGIDLDDMALHSRSTAPCGSST